MACSKVLLCGDSTTLHRHTVHWSFTDLIQDSDSALITPASPLPRACCLHFPELTSSDLDGLRSPSRGDYHIIQDILERKEERSCKHALANFGSNSYRSTISQQTFLLAFAARTRMLTFVQA